MHAQRSSRFTGLTASVFLGAIASIALGFSTLALAGEALDLSPQQPGRIRVDKDLAAIKAISPNFHFVKEGTLTVAIHPTIPPISTYATDAKTIVGYDADLAQVVADSLGRKLELVPVSWADWPLALESGKVDAVLSNVTVTEARKQKFDFSSYRQDKVGFYVKSDSKITSLKEPKDVAGLRIITDSGTNQEKILLAWDKENVAHGLKPVEVQYYDEVAVKNLALQAGRADAIFSVNATQAYQAALQGKTRLAGTVSGGWPRTAELAIATRKGSGLADAFTTSLNDLIASGVYTRVLDRWNLGSEAITKSATNPPGLPNL
nr:L-cystine-binding protein FliY [Paraburkholderia busanensis]